MLHLRFDKEDWQWQDAFVKPKKSLASWEKHVFNRLQSFFDPSIQYFSFQTSGSTGKPKNISIHREQIMASALTSLTFFELTAGQRVLLCLSTERIGGCMLLYRAVLGQLEVFVTEPSRSVPCELPVDFTSLVPLQFHALRENNPEHFNQLGTILLGGSPIDQDTESFIQGLDNEVYQSFGMTETVSHIALRKVGYESAYTCLPNISVAKGDQNELLISAPSITGQEILRTQDVVSIINDKQFIWKGRLDFAINSGGVKIYPEEVEALCAQKIAEPLVVSSAQDKALGSIIVLCIESSDGKSLERIQRVLDTIYFPRYHRPKKVLRISKIPRLESGKINRMEVEEFLR
ncbi:MAG: hypothetical protein CMN34_00900 [Saprospirales bacterium]|nr:hypothetical protein [Saprospirales bacterium]